MMWKDEERKVKITIARHTAQGNDLSIIFCLLEKGREEFHKLLNGFLDFCRDNEGHVSVDEVIDSETHQPAQLLIKIRGNQQRLGQELQQRAPAMAAVCEWAK